MAKIVKKINVSKRSIKEGKQEQCDSCPVALAVKKTLKLPETQKVHVGDNIEIRVLETDEVLYRMSLPKKVERFINQFDATEPSNQQDCRVYGQKLVYKKDIKPFSFVLKLEEVNSETV